MILKDFIVFEGIDGAGTTTQIKKLVESNPDKYFQTSEPTGGEIGRFLRKMLKGEFSVDERTNAYLFAADRCEHLYGKGGIIEKIKEGKTVVSDRYLFSSIAYQSVTCGKELPVYLNNKFPLPEYLFFFEINPEISLKRVEDRIKKINTDSNSDTKVKTEIYEKLDFQNKTAKLYSETIEYYENLSETTEDKIKIFRIDATKSIDEIYSQIQNILNNN